MNCSSAGRKPVASTTASKSAVLSTMFVYDDPERESNVRFRLPYETVVEAWRRCIAAVYRPDALFRRFATIARLASSVCEYACAIFNPPTSGLTTTRSSSFFFFKYSYITGAA